ncbi:MAG: DsbA family protein [Saprospiraceae bacterium]|nr:DsbA family protein [Saprospiraceae bacterium]
MELKIIYLYDALCGWCYGFSPVMQRIHEKYAGQIEFEVMSGGMIMGLRAGPIGEVAPYIAKAYTDVENATGIKFGAPFLEQILAPGTAIFSSEMPGIAMTVFRKQRPEQVMEFAHVLQNALYSSGIELSIAENYIPLVESFGLSGPEFVEALQNEENRYETMLEFQTVANWGVNGFPTVLLKPASDHQYYMIARGYTSFERLDEVIGKFGG